MAFNPHIYRQTVTFAGKAHAGHHIPGTTIPYVTHLAAVAAETISAILQSNEDHLDIDFAVQCALLHDVIEDTSVKYEELITSFGEKVAQGVLALTKNDQLPFSEQMADSLKRILEQGPEVRIVKMADRIDNLYLPALYWTSAKRKYYQEEARLILDTLKGVNPYIEQRLAQKIEDYTKYF
ncbi:MAG: HD domain-containing protein [Microscillaceae bacterium]|nr:HD domain-containing protein [Microscillaceae bacterium]